MNNLKIKLVCLFAAVVLLTAAAYSKQGPWLSKPVVEIQAEDQPTSTVKALVVDKSDISISKKNGDRHFQGQLFNGEAVSYFNNGVRATSEIFKNGKREGTLKRWFINGNLGFESNYKAGHREGVTKSWWSNGNKRSETFYVNNKAEGVSWKWYRTGEKFKKFNYVAGRPDGIQQGWRINGKLFTNFEYKNGRTYGLKKSNMCVGLKDEEILL